MSVTSHQEIQILHVDDDPSITDLTGTFLEREDDQFTIETATSADDGLENITDHPPDCVVSDYNMPGMDGIEFLQTVREEYPDIPFILFTGRGSEAVASEAIAADVTDYLQKGSGSEKYELLANRIRNAVRARRETRRADRQEQLMRLTEFAGDTGGFEINVDSEDLLLTDGTRRLVGLSDDTRITLEEAIELYHPDDQADVRQTITRAAGTGEETRGTWRLQTLDGDERLVNVTMVSTTENGDATILRGAVHDVTERRKHRRELEQVETWFQYAQTGLILLDVGEEFTVERVNPMWEETTGQSADQVRGRTLQNVLGEQAGAIAREKTRECVQEREPVQFEEYVQFDGEQTIWETRIAPVIVEETVEYVVGETREVTAHRERQQELQRLQQAIDGANVPITLADPSQPDNPLVYVNNAFEEMTGYPPKETLGRNCRFLQGEDTDPEKVAALREAIDNEESISVELRNYRKDGTEFWNHLTVTPIYNDDGELVRYLGTQENVTERKRSERELRTERRFIEQALDTLDDLFYVLETDGTLRRWNNRVPQTTGYADSELADMQAIKLFPEDDRETIADAIQMAVSGETVTFEADLFTADGERRPYEFTGARLTDSGENTTGLVGIGRDLTERKQRERRFQALVEESNDIISIVDIDGVFQYQSPSVERVLGYEPEDTIGDTAWEYVHPDDRADLIEAFERGVADPDANPVFEYRVRHADGSWRWMEANSNNQLDNPAVEGYIVNSRDITERKERERELAQTHDLMANMEQLADVGAWEYDSATETTIMTDGTRRIHGLDPSADLTLEAAFDCFHPDDRDLLEERFTECLETGEPYEVNVRLTTAEGAQRWVTARGERVDKPGSDSVVRGYIRDVTESKTRERQLTELNQALQDLLTAETRQEVADIGVRAARDVLEFQANAVHLCEADDTLAPVAQTDELVSLLDEVPSLSVADSVAGRVYQRGEPTVVEDARHDPDAHDSETDLKGHVYLPLAEHGVLIAGSEAEAAFDQQHLAVGELLAGNLVAALDRIEREQTVSRQQQQLALFFEESPLGAVQWDDDFQLERLNERGEEILGYSEAELRGESWEMIVADEDRDQVGDAVENLFAADGGRHVFNTNVRGDGQMITCEWHNRAVTDADGDVQAVLSKFQDATEQKERERELESKRRFIEQSLDVLDDLFYVIDTDGTLRRWNAKAPEATGYNESELDGMPAIELFPEDERETVNKSIETALTDGKDMIEVDLLTADGQRVPYEFTGARLADEDGNTAGLVGIGRDVTGGRERTYQELAEEYEALLETSGDAIFMLDVDTSGEDPAFEFTRLSPGYETQTGISTEEVRGKTPQAVFGDERGAELEANYTRCVEQRSPISYREELDLADDARVWETSLAPVTIDDEVIRIVGIARNVTEQVEREHGIQRQNERLDEFASIVSHDLRNPLQVAEGRLELIREECESDHIDDVAQALDRIDTLIEDVLTLARDGKQVDETESVGLANVAEDSWQTVSTAQATLETEGSQAVKADRSRLRQLFENLYRNAVEHGSNNVTVTVGTVDDGFYVADTGPGIPESEREDIFEAGYSTNEDGTGFGLRIVKQIAHAHGWEITVTESEQGGARFEITGVEFADH